MVVFDTHCLYTLSLIVIYFFGIVRLKFFTILLQDTFKNNSSDCSSRIACILEVEPEWTEIQPCSSYIRLELAMIT